MRLLTRLLAALFALAVAGLGALAVVETCWALIRPETTGLLVPWRSAATLLSGVRWSDPAVSGIAGAVALLGVLVLLIAVTAHRRDIQLHDPAPAVHVVTSRHALARLVAHRVRSQEEVESASVTARRKRVRVRARINAPETHQAHERIDESARRAVQELPLPRHPRVSVSVSEVKEPK